MIIAAVLASLLPAALLLAGAPVSASPSAHGPVSVVVAASSAACPHLFLKSVVDLCTRQRGPDGTALEVVVVDTAPPPGPSDQVLLALQQFASAVVLRHAPYASAAEAKLEGLRVATGDVVVMWDVGMLSAPDRIATQVAPILAGQVRAESRASFVSPEFPLHGPRPSSQADVTVVEAKALYDAGSGAMYDISGAVRVLPHAVALSRRVVSAGCTVVDSLVDVRHNVLLACALAHRFRVASVPSRLALPVRTPGHVGDHFGDGDTALVVVPNLDAAVASGVVTEVPASDQPLPGVTRLEEEDAQYFSLLRLMTARPRGLPPQHDRRKRARTSMPTNEFNRRRRLQRRLPSALRVDPDAIPAVAAAAEGDQFVLWPMPEEPHALPSSAALHTLRLLTDVAPVANSSDPCGPEGVDLRTHYYDSAADVCRNCTTCPEAQFPLAPCAEAVDTVCACTCRFRRL